MWIQKEGALPCAQSRLRHETPMSATKKRKTTDAAGVDWSTEAKAAGRAAEKRLLMAVSAFTKHLEAGPEHLWASVCADEKFADRLRRAREGGACTEEIDRFLEAMKTSALPSEVDPSTAAASLVLGSFCFTLLPLWVETRGLLFMLDVVEVIYRRGLREECDGKRCWVVESAPTQFDPWLDVLAEHAASLDEASIESVRARAIALRAEAPLAVRWALSSIMRDRAWIDSDVQAALDASAPFPATTLLHAGDLERAAQLVRQRPSNVLEKLAPHALRLVQARGLESAALLGEIARQGIASLDALTRPPTAYDWETTLASWEPLVHAIGLVGGSVGVEALVELLARVKDIKLTKAAALTRGTAMTALLKHPALAQPLVERHATEPWAAVVVAQMRRANST